MRVRHAIGTAKWLLRNGDGSNLKYKIVVCSVYVVNDILGTVPNGRIRRKDTRLLTSDIDSLIALAQLRTKLSIAYTVYTLI